LTPHWLGAVHIEDVVEACRLALENTDIRFNVFHIAADGPAAKFDISKAKAMLGYKPKHRLSESARPSSLQFMKGLISRARGALQ
jgi:nucleoside-diphosphate-sugar epimerase